MSKIRLSPQVRYRVIWLALPVAMLFVGLSSVYSKVVCSNPLPCFANTSLPHTDLVFQIYPAEPDASGSLGFINADGSGETILRDIVYSAVLPVWSPDGNRVVYRQSPPVDRYDYGGMIAVVGHRTYCGNQVGHGRAHWTPDGSAILEAYISQQDRTWFTSEVVSVDASTCQVTHILYSGRFQGTISDPTLSATGSLAFTRSTLVNDHKQIYESEIVVVDLSTKREQVVGQGIAPAWSHAGEWLAYTGKDGLYRVRADGSNSQKIVDYCAFCKIVADLPRTWNDWPPLPNWSPDDRSLIYHREEQGQFAIYDFDLLTRQETKIVDNGLNPDWRP